MIDALRYEMVRLRTLRSTAWLLGIAVGVQVVLSLLIAWRVSESSAPSTGDSTFAAIATLGASSGLAPLLVAYVLGLIGVFSMGHEYRHGLIRTTLTVVSSRSAVYAAKVVTVAAVTAAASLACVAVAVLSLVPFGLDLPSGDELVSLTLGLVVFTTLFGLSGLGMAAIVRNQTVAVALLMLVPTVLESIVRAVVLTLKLVSDDPQGRTGLVGVLRFLPYDAGGQMYTRASVDDLFQALGAVPFGPVGGGLVMAVFVAVLLLVGGWRLLRRDA